jgi:hypothetical protein
MALPNVVTNIGAVKPHVRPVAEEIATTFPPIFFLWGKSSGTSGEHPKGLALDFSILDKGAGVSRPGGARTSLGQKIANYLWDNRKRLNIWYVIWNRRVISANRDSYAYNRWVTYKGPKSHTDHVHVSFWASGTYKPPAAGAGGGTAGAKRVSLKALQAAARADPGRRQGGTTGGSADDVRIVEDALRREGLLSTSYAGDGSFGTRTVAAYAAWQRRCGYSGDDADGIPGGVTLKRLGSKYGFSVVQ